MARRRAAAAMVVVAAQLVGAYAVGAFKRPSPSLAMPRHFAHGGHGEGAEGGGRRTDKSKAGGCRGFREGGVFAEEAISRMDGVSARFFGGRDDAVDVEVCRRPDTGESDSVVGALHVQGIRVISGVNRRCRDSGLCRGACDTDRDLAAVGDQDVMDDVLFRHDGQNS